jgi:hypothetical protein
MKWLIILLAALTLTGCDYEEVKHEIGYKGKARVNPWLAAERFCANDECSVKSLAAWTAPTEEDAVWFVPAAILSNDRFTRQLDGWVAAGGHLVLLVSHANSEINDWFVKAEEPDLPPAVGRMLGRVKIELTPVTEERKAKEIHFLEESYQVDATSDTQVKLAGKEPQVFVSVEKGKGRLTVLTDARLFRNRWIGEKDHAALLDALISATDRSGNIGFLRGSGLSLWGLLKQHLWPVLIALGVLLFLWLWKNLSRFGPLEAVAGVPILRGYEHHLEALGYFQWRLDRSAALLVPLRMKIVERGQRISVRAGCRDEDFFQFLADRAGLPRERVHRAMSEAAPSDTTVLTRTTADLQRLLLVLH